MVAIRHPTVHSGPVREAEDERTLQELRFPGKFARFYSFYVRMFLD